MAHCSTLKAHLLSTVTLLRVRVEATSFRPSNIILTPNFGTPFEIFVGVHVYVFFEEKIFFVYFLTAKIFDVVWCIVFFAFKIHTLYFYDLAISDLGF